MAKCSKCGSPACMCGSPNHMVDPTMASVGIDPNLTYQPPMPANQMGVAKPIFSPQVQASAEYIYGTPEQRQMSVPGAAMFMKDIPEGSEGKGLRKLPDNVVEKMGYDAATKMVSPLGMHHSGRNSVGAEMVGKEIPKKMSKKLTKKPRVPVVENTTQAFGITKNGKKVNLGKITSTEIPEKYFKQR